MTAGEVEGTLRLRDDATAAISRATQALRGFGSQTAVATKDVSGLGGMLKNAVSTLAGMAGGDLSVRGLMASFGGLKEAIIGTNATLETSTLQFETLMGDADRAKEHVAGLFEFAKVTPFETGPVIQASKLLQTFGGDALNTKANLTLVGDAAAATGANISDLGFWVGRAYSMIKGGQPFGEAAMRLQEMAVLSPQARKEMEALGVTAEDNAKKWEILQGELGKFSGAMIKQSKTWAGVTSTLKDVFNLSLAKAFQPAFEALRDSMGDLADYLSGPEFTKSAQSFMKGMSEAFKTVGSLARELWPLIKEIGSVMLSVAQTAVDVARAIINGWNALPGWFKEIAKVAGEVAIGIWAIHAAWKGVMALQTVSWLKSVGAQLLILLSYTKSEGWAGFGYVLGQWAKPLTSAWGGLAKLVTSFVALGPAIGTVGGASVGLVGALGGIAIAVASVTAVVKLGIEAWKYYKASQEWDQSNAYREAEKRQQIIIANNLSLKDGKGPITEYGKAMEFIAQRGADLRSKLIAATVATNEHTKANEPAKTAAEKTAEAMAKARDALSSMSAETRAGIAAAIAMGQTQKQISQQFQISAATIRLFKQEMKDTGPAANFAKSMAELSVQLIAAKEAGVPLKMVLDEYGSKIEDVALKAPIFGKAISDAVKEAYEALRQSQMDEAIKKLKADTGEMMAEWQKDILAKGAAKAAVSIEGMGEAMKVAASYQVKLTQATITGTNLRLAQIETERKAALDAFKVVPVGAEQEYAKARAAINAYYDWEKRKAEQTFDTIIDRMHDLGVATKKELAAMAKAARTDYDQMKESGAYTAAQLQDAWERWYKADKEAQGEWASGFFQNLSDISAAFDNLAETAGGDLADIAKMVATTADAMLAGRESAQTLEMGFKQLGTNAVAGLANIVQGALGVVSAMAAATQSTDKLTNALSGAATGASIGGSVGGGWGALAGSIVGAFYGIFAAGKNAKMQVNDLRDAYVEAAGGIDALNQAAVGAGWTLEYFLKADTVKEYEAAVKALEEAIGSYADKVSKAITDISGVTDAGELAGKDLLASLGNYLVDYAGAVDPEVQAALQDFFAANVSAAAQGLNAYAEVQTSIDTAVKDAKATIDTLKESVSKGDATEEQKKQLKDLEEYVRKVGVVMGETGTTSLALADATAATFGEMIAQGATTAEALEAISPSILSVTQSLKDTGQVGSESFQLLSAMAAMAADEVAGPALDSITALGTTLTGLQNTGILTQSTFSGLAGQITQTFEGLKSEGYDSEAAMASIAPTLQTLWELQNQFGFSVNAATDALLNEAFAAGYVGDTQMSAQDRTAKAMEHVAALIEALCASMGVTLPAAVGTAADSFETFSTEAGGAVSDAIGQAADDSIESLDRLAVEATASMTDATGEVSQEAMRAMREAVKAAEKIEAEVMKQAKSAMDETARAAEEMAQSIIDANALIPDIRIGVGYDVEGFPELQGMQDQEIAVKGAQEGVYSSKPTLRVFGEGGEPELGGPVDFMAKVLKLAQGRGDTGTAATVGGDALTLNITLTTLDAADMKTKVEREVIPMIVEAVQQNRRSARTKLSAALEG